MNPELTDQELIEALEASPNFTTVRDSDHLAELLGLGEGGEESSTEAPGEGPGPDAHTMTFTGPAERGYVECQYVNSHEWHVAEYSHQGQWGNQTLYAVVCCGYTDYYDSTVLFEELAGALSPSF